MTAAGARHPDVYVTDDQIRERKCEIGWIQPWESHPDAVRRRESFVYLLRYDNGVVKIGHSNGPNDRISLHRAAGRRRGLTTTTAWLSPPHLHVERTERSLLNFAAENYEPAWGNEFFHADFQALIQFFGTLRVERSTGPVMAPPYRLRRLYVGSVIVPAPRRKPAMATRAPIRRFT